MKRNLTLLVLPLLLLAGCKKEGCTDKEALNYNPEAKEDDGTCVFKEDIKAEMREEIADSIAAADEQQDQQLSDSVKTVNAIVEEFTLTFSTTDTYKSWSPPVDLTENTLLMYVEHIQFSNEWVQLPYTVQNTSFYFSEDGSFTVWLYIENANDGSAVFSQNTDVNYKAVILPNEFLKENPEIKNYDYPSLQKELNL